MGSREKKVQRGSQQARELGQVIRQIRLAQHLTQARLAEAAELDPKYIGLVETGRTNISLPNLLKLADGLQLSPGELLSAAFPTEDRSAILPSLLRDTLALLQNEDMPTLELLRSILHDIKVWEESRHQARTKASSPQSLAP